MQDKEGKLVPSGRAEMRKCTLSLKFLVPSRHSKQSGVRRWTEWAGWSITLNKLRKVQRGQFQKWSCSKWQRACTQFSEKWEAIQSNEEICTFMDKLMRHWHKLAKLQRIQNSAARLVLRKPKRESSHTLLRALPVKARIEFKIATFCYQHLHSETMPPYLFGLLTFNTPSRTVHTSRRLSSVS